MDYEYDALLAVLTLKPEDMQYLFTSFQLHSPVHAPFAHKVIHVMYKKSITIEDWACGCRSESSAKAQHGTSVALPTCSPIIAGW